MHRMTWRIGTVAAVGVLAAISAFLLRAPADKPASPAPNFDLPRISESPYLNATSAATYVGIAVCAECHADQHATYRATAHSVALADLDPAVEPRDAGFTHARSGRTYRVYREQGQMHHHEAVQDTQGNEIVSSDFPIRYLIGSGRHTRSYLVDDGGFLVESPLTWFVSQNNWGMSPGYDNPSPLGFERAADTRCLICHVGRMDTPESVYQRVNILEQPIGCERCHGPGSLHAASERAVRGGGARPNAAHGATIVNPANLRRELAESICAQCHLRGDATVVVRGRSLTDFRPGLPLADFAINYHSASADSTMKVVGHVEQLSLSACYQASTDLTCATCHALHAPPPSGNKENRQHYVEACLKCHAAENCRLDSDVRLRESPGNDCVACHMPQAATDIAHIAFTHHRIGVHTGESRQTAGGRIVALVPFDDESHLSPVDRDRNLGLAYLALSRKQNQEATVTIYLDRALTLLERVHDQGLPDPEVTAALAQIYWARDPQTAFRLAREALESDTLSPSSRVNCLFVVGDAGLATDQVEAARLALEKLVTLRRISEDWLLLAQCRQRSGDLHAALRDLERAAAIAPFRPNIHEALAQLHEQLGDADAAARERVLAAQVAMPPSQK